MSLEFVDCVSCYCNTTGVLNKEYWHVVVHMWKQNILWLLQLLTGVIRNVCLLKFTCELFMCKD